MLSIVWGNGGDGSNGMKSIILDVLYVIEDKLSILI